MAQPPQAAEFASFPLLESIHESIRKAHYERPTPIQAACIPHAIEGKDLIGLAQTGTGKTAAFAIPIIQRLAGRTELGALVLAPTRELAAQITAMFNVLGAGSGVRVATIVGGVPMDKDTAALRSWPNVLVATPGRLIDHIENTKINLSEIEVLVVDEADRMHDMGFIPQIRRILVALPAKRQTMMFTATLPADVEHIARKSMRDPVRVQIGATAPANRARQELIELSEDAKTPLLVKMLHELHGRTLIFLRTKRGVDRLHRVINARNLRAHRIHGDLEQAQRDKALADFREGRCRVLVATDIAARGLDVTGIEHVVNFDFPHHAEDYVHRIGRTARVDASGLATSFITYNDQRFVREVRQLIGDKLPAATRLESYGTTPERGSVAGHGYGRGGAKRGHGARPGRGGGHGSGHSSGHIGGSGRGRQAAQGQRGAGAAVAAQGQPAFAQELGEHQGQPQGEYRPEGGQKRGRRGRRGRGGKSAQQAPAPQVVAEV